MPDNMGELYRVIDSLRGRLAEAEERIDGLERSSGTVDDDDAFTTEDSFPQIIGSPNLDVTMATRYLATGTTIPDKGASSWYALTIDNENISPPILWFRGSDLPSATASAGDAVVLANALPFQVFEVTTLNSGANRYIYLQLTSDDELLFAINSTAVDPMPLTIHHWFDRSSPEQPDAPTLSGRNTEIRVDWTKPHGFVNDYNIRYREARTTVWMDWQHDGTDLTATITGLVNNTEYEVQVQAANDSNSSPWSDSSTATPLPLQMLSTEAVVFTSQQQFTDAFEDEIIGTTNGQWAFDSTGSTSSGNTGPGTNNSLTFMHTETSSGTSEQAMEANGDIMFAILPTGISRTLHMRLCIQGQFGNGQEGLQVNHRARETDAWAEAGFIHGWDYSDTYSAGGTVTDEDGNTLTFVADGGWVDFEIIIPDTATQVQLQPRYINRGNIYEHDIAFRQFHWEYLGNP